MLTITKLLILEYSDLRYRDSAVHCDPNPLLDGPPSLHKITTLALTNSNPYARSNLKYSELLQQRKNWWHPLFFAISGFCANLRVYIQCNDQNNQKCISLMRDFTLLRVSLLREFTVFFKFHLNQHEKRNLRSFDEKYFVKIA